MTIPTPDQIELAAELLANIAPHPGKTCSGCTACCSVVPVREVGVKAWERCPYVRTPPSNHVGCSIYPKRPRSCRIWSCGWLATDWPDDLRPDRCGVIVDPADELVWVNGKELPAARLWVLPGHEEDWNRDPAQALILSIIDAGLGVLWDMAPDTIGQRLARVFRRNEDGRLEVGPPTPAAKTSMSEVERFERSRQLQKARSR